MKQLLLTLITVATAQLTLAGLTGSPPSFGERDMVVTIKNLTKGQPMTPPVVTVRSSGSLQLYKLGSVASPGLAAQAKDGSTDLLVEELNNNKYIKQVFVGEGVIPPGESRTVIIRARGNQRVGVTTMLARTNDAIAVTERVIANNGSGVLKVYDAGAEANTESCDHIPAPPCGNPGMGQAGEGFIHDHPGLQGIGDLDLQKYAFGSIVGTVEIRAVQ